MKCLLCGGKVAKRVGCDTCDEDFCSRKCRGKHECSRSAEPQEGEREKKPKTRLTSTGKGFRFHLIVVHTSPSGGVESNAVEIVKYVPSPDTSVPVLFAGDWYIPEDDEINKGGVDGLEWTRHLSEKSLTWTGPKGKTNLPGKGRGMIADYFILGPPFTGAAEIVTNGSGEYDDVLYGWKRPLFDLSDHAPVRATISPPKRRVVPRKTPRDRATSARSTTLSSNTLSDKPSLIQCPKPPTFDAFDIITWNLNHYGAAKGTRAKAKRLRKAEAIRWMLQFNPMLLVLQEVNDVSILLADLALEDVDYAAVAGPLVNIDKNNQYAQKQQDFKEYFPCIYDPRRCSVTRVGVWDGYTGTLHKGDTVLYTATRPAVVYEITLKEDGFAIDDYARLVDPIFHIADDGDCLFAAIAKGASDRGTTGWNAKKLRQRVAAALKKCRDRVEMQLTAILNDLEKMADRETRARAAVDSDFTEPELTGEARTDMIQAVENRLKGWTYDEKSWKSPKVDAFKACYKTPPADVRKAMVERLEHVTGRAAMATAVTIIDAVGPQLGPNLRPFMRKALESRLQDSEFEPVWTDEEYYDAVDAYIDDIAGSNMFGGELELSLAAEIVDHQVDLYEPGQGRRTILTPEDADGEDPIILHYNGRDHYDVFNPGCEPSC